MLPGRHPSNDYVAVWGKESAISVSIRHTWAESREHHPWVAAHGCVTANANLAGDSNVPGDVNVPLKVPRDSIGIGVYGHYPGARGAGCAEVTPVRTVGRRRGCIGGVDGCGIGTCSCEIIDHRAGRIRTYESRAVVLNDLPTRAAGRRKRRSLHRAIGIRN